MKKNLQLCHTDHGNTYHLDQFSSIPIFEYFFIPVFLFFHYNRARVSERSYRGNIGPGLSGVRRFDFFARPNCQFNT